MNDKIFDMHNMPLDEFAKRLCDVENQNQPMTYELLKEIFPECGESDKPKILHTEVRFEFDEIMITTDLYYLTCVDLLMIPIPKSVVVKLDHKEGYMILGRAILDLFPGIPYKEITL